jgi:asparagine synthase (glutamine-hydrolysing)
MCGIAGFWQPAFEAAAAPEVVLAMLGAVAHRGPDEHGYYYDERAALAVARLAVLDPATGQQPMADPEGRHWIAYNGEIYNYRELRQQLLARGRIFRTRSDTEVLLAAWLEWGEDAFARCNGGYAAAIYDRVTRRLVLTRDRWGKRPLFYTSVGSALIFASELKAFLAYPGIDLRWDVAQLSSLFTLWTPLPDSTPFVGVRQVPPGAVLTATAGGIRARQAVAVDLVGEPFSGSHAAAEAELRQALDEAVRLRLRSDVEVGAYVSGGLDSAIVAQLANARLGGSLRTFSIGFPGAHADESEEQQRLGVELGARHTLLPIEGEQLAGGFAAAVTAAEVPVFRTALVPMLLLSQTAREHGVEVVLTGEGADETFLGYDVFKEALLRARWPAMADVERREALTCLYRHQPHFGEGNLPALVAAFSAQPGGADDPLASHRWRFANGAFARRLLAEPADGLAPLAAWVEQHRDAFERFGVIGRAQWLEIATLLGGYLLSSQGDRMAFAHGVENRCPFLDPAVTALAARLPVEWRLDGLQREKAILRSAFADRLPAWVAARPKQPFVAPDATVVVREMARGGLADLLAPDELERVGVLDVRFASALRARLGTLSPWAVSPRESQAFLLLLSLVILDRALVRRQLPRRAPHGELRIARDGRAGATRPLGGGRERAFPPC